MEQQSEEKTGSLAAPPPKKTETSDLVSAIRNSLKQPSAKEITDLGDMQRAMVDDQKTDTKLKKVYAYWFIGILIGQLAAMNLVFVAVGRNVLAFNEPSHLNLFMGGTLTEVFGVVYVITRYLFSKRENSSVTGINTLTARGKKNG